MLIEHLYSGMESASPVKLERASVLREKENEYMKEREKLELSATTDLS